MRETKTRIWRDTQKTTINGTVHTLVVDNLQVEYWFKKNNYMSKFLSEESREIIQRLKEKHEREEAEKHKPKPRGRKRKR